MGVVDGGRRFETHCAVGMFRIILGIRVESAYLSVCSLLNKDITEPLMMEQVFFPKMLYFYKQLLLTSLEEGSL